MTTLDALMPANIETRKTLADMIMEKLNAAESAESTGPKKVRISTTTEPREGLSGYTRFDNVKTKISIW